MFWYILILPFTLMGGIFRFYVITWGVLFFILCFVVLNLGSLPEIEFVFWPAIFWSKRGLDSKKRLAVFFDDKCYLCDRTVQIITMLDIFGRVTLKPISENIGLLGKLNIKRENALTDFYGVAEETGEAASGYDFYILLSKNLFLLWPLAPLLYFAKLLKIGPGFYRLISSRRHELFGVCSLARKKIARQPTEGATCARYLHPAIILHVFFLAGCYLITLPAPYIGIEGPVNISSRAPYYYGIAPINVFNLIDLKLAENWFTLKSISHNELVPVLSESGTRLAMHQSDRVYYGNTLKFRRRNIGKDKCFFEDEKKKSLDYLGKVYLHIKGADSGTYSFRYDQYNQPLPNMDDISEGIYRPYQKGITCSVLFNVDYAT